MLTKRLALVAIAAAMLAPARAYARGKEHIVRITNFAFEPANLIVAPGDTVTFINDDNAPHTATSSGDFDTGRLDRGDRATVTISGAGRFNYRCTFHPMMKGSIIAG